MTTSEPRPHPPLDDAMIAMDVAAVLSRARRTGASSLPTDRADMIDHLREVYRSQGIDVSDQAIGRGLDAFERGVRVPKPRGSRIELALARLYVTRQRWAVPAGALALAASVVLLCLAFWP